MRDIDYGSIRLKLKDFMVKQHISINRLANRAEMQRTQLRAYMDGSMIRVDLCVLARLCYALDCDIADLLEYENPDLQQKNQPEDTALSFPRTATHS